MLIKTKADKETSRTLEWFLDHYLTSQIHLKFMDILPGETIMIPTCHIPRGWVIVNFQSS